VLSSPQISTSTYTLFQCNQHKRVCCAPVPAAAWRQAEHRRAVYQNSEILQVAEPVICQAIQNLTYTPQPVSHDESHLIHCPNFLWHYSLIFEHTVNPNNSILILPTPTTNSIHVKVERSILKHHSTPILIRLHYQYINSPSQVSMPLHKTQFNRNTNTDASPDGYSSLPGSSTNQNQKPCINWWTAWRHMHTRQAVSRQNPETRKTAHTRWRLHTHMIIQSTIWWITMETSENKSPYLDFPFFTRILSDFTNPTTPWVFSCTPTLSSTLSSLNCTCQHTKMLLSSSLSVSSPLCRWSLSHNYNL